MITRRRKCFFAGAFLTVAVVALLWVARSQRKMEVKLIFLGYTNVPFQGGGAIGIGPEGWPWEIYGLLIVTNADNAPVRIWSGVLDANSLASNSVIKAREGFEIPLLLEDPGTLAYGVARPVHTWVGGSGRGQVEKPWSVGLLVRRQHWREGANGRVSKWLASRVPAWADKIVPVPEPIWIQCGPITNKSVGMRLYGPRPGR